MYKLFIAITTVAKPGINKWVGTDSKISRFAYQIALM
jgi:hypothetical protein